MDNKEWQQFYQESMLKDRRISVLEREVDSLQLQLRELRIQADAQLELKTQHIRILKQQLDIFRKIKRRQIEDEDIVRE